MKIKTSSITYLWIFIISVAFALRCLPSLIFRPSWLEYVLVGGFGVLSLFFAFVVSKKKMVLLPVDFFWFLTPIFLVNSKTSNFKFIFYLIVTIVAYLVIQVHPTAIKAIKYPFLCFAVLTSVVTWISFFAKDFYISRILSLFPESDSLVYSFLNKNMYHGFTNHYSRNAWYISIAIMLLFCELICMRRVKKAIVIPLIIFFTATQLLVAKRGPSLALIVTLFLVYILREPSFIKSLGKSVKFIIGAVVLFAMLYLFVPGVDNMITRVFTKGGSSDITTSRMYLWGIALQMFWQSPLFGSGWGGFLFRMRDTTNFQGVHNDYLQYLAETGIVGFVYFVYKDIKTLILSVRVFKYFRTEAWNGTDEQYWLALSLTMQIFILLYALTGLPHFSYEQYGLFTILCGYSIGRYKSVRKMRTTLGGNK